MFEIVFAKKRDKRRVFAFRCSRHLFVELVGFESERENKKTITVVVVRKQQFVRDSGTAQTKASGGRTRSKIFAQIKKTARRCALLRSIARSTLCCTVFFCAHLSRSATYSRLATDSSALDGRGAELLALRIFTICAYSMKAVCSAVARHTSVWCAQNRHKRLAISHTERRQTLTQR